MQIPYTYVSGGQYQLIHYHMKKTILIVVVVALLGAGAWYITTKGSVTKYVKQTETKEVLVDALDKQIADAIQASSTEIEIRAKNAYGEAKRRAEDEVKLQVTTEYRKSLEAKEKELMKDASF